MSQYKMKKALFPTKTQTHLFKVYFKSSKKLVILKVPRDRQVMLAMLQNKDMVFSHPTLIRKYLRRRFHRTIGQYLPLKRGIYLRLMEFCKDTEGNQIDFYAFKAALGMIVNNPRYLANVLTHDFRYDLKNPTQQRITLEEKIYSAKKLRKMISQIEVSPRKNRYPVDAKVVVVLEAFEREHTDELAQAGGK